MISFNEWMRRFLLLPEQASSFSARLDHLHYFVILTSFGGAFCVFAMTAYFVIRFRRRSEFETTRKITAKPLVEFLYITTPLALFVLWFFMGFARYMELRLPPGDSMIVYVTSKQWMWKFSYPEGPNSIDILRVPAGKPVRLLLTSRDVIHSFYVPAFRIKQDAVPGRYTDVWFEAVKPGRYRVFCAEYCGLKHSQMFAEIVALAPEDYDKWLDEQRVGLVTRRDASEAPDEGSLPSDSLTPGPYEFAPGPFAPRELPKGDLALQGRDAAAREGCLKCHTTDGTPHLGPTWRDLYMRRETLTDGSTVLADEAYLTRSMMDPDVQIVAGFKPIMPSYQGHLPFEEAAAIVEFIKSLRSERPPPSAPDERSP